MKEKRKLRFSKMMKKEKKIEKPRKEKVLQKSAPETIPLLPGVEDEVELPHEVKVKEKEKDEGILEKKEEKNFEYMVFKIDNELYGIRIDYVKEIVNKIELMQVPNLPPFVIGLLEMREGMVPVINIRKRFKIGEGEEGNAIIITNVRNEVVGFLVDKVMEIIKVEEDDIMAVPFIFDEKERSYITGIIEFNDSLISILSVENILEEEELTKIEKLSKE